MYIIDEGCCSDQGLLAARLGAHVTLTDRADKRDVLELAAVNCKLNNVQGNTDVVCMFAALLHVLHVAALCLFVQSGYSWGAFPSGAAESVFASGDDFDLIIGADIFYDAALFEPVLASIAYFASRNPRLRFITAYQQRSVTHSIAALLEKWGMTAAIVGVGSDFAAQFPEHTASLDVICVFEITMLPVKVPHQASWVPEAQISYAETGFAIIRNVLSVAQLQAVRSECDALCAMIEPSRCEFSLPSQPLLVEHNTNASCFRSD